MLKNSLFGAVKLTTSANSDKYSYSGYRMGFDTFVFFSLSDSGIGKIVITFDADISSSVHIDNKKIYILKMNILSSTDGLDDTKLTGEYSINFSGQQKRFCLSIHYSKSNSFLFVHGVKIHQIKAKDSKLNAYSLCLGNISKDFTVDNMEKLDYVDMCIIFHLTMTTAMMLTIF